MNVVAVVGQQRLDARGALLEAVDQAAEGAEEDAEVVEQVDARQPLEHREDDARAAAHDAGREARRGEEDAQRATLEEAREAVGRVEEVQRVARRRRVEHEDVEAPRRVELVELGHRGELLRAGDGARELLVDAVGEDLVARALVGGEALDELVEGALGSSIIAHSSPRISMPWPAKRSGSTRRGSLSSSSTPSALASRRAGSMVTTATRAPAAARPIASAADVVVLPTPPEPRRHDALVAQRAAHSDAFQLTRERRQPVAASKTCGSVATGRGPAAQARELRPLRARAARGDSARRGPPVRRAPPRARRTSAALKRRGSMPLATTSSTSRPSSSRSASWSAASR